MSPGLVGKPSPHSIGFSVWLSVILLFVSAMAEMAACSSTIGAGADAGAVDAPPWDHTAPGAGSVADAQGSPSSNAPSDAGTLDTGTSLGADTGAADDAAGNAISEAAVPDDGARPGWKLVWNDEFNGAAGSPPDSTKWTPHVGGKNPNNELEYYTNRPTNLHLDGNGNLLITALRESFMGASYTSARIDTAGKFEQAYGRFETRVKLPVGQGMWPAFWILGNNAGQVGWPQCGECDIMEAVGRDPLNNHGSLHGPGYSGGNCLTGTFKLDGGYSSDFHVIAAEWELNVVRFYVDENLYETRTPADLVARGGNLKWVYDHPFYVILNLAVGGDFPGSPDNTTPFPQSLMVDYVRVYSR